MAGGSWANVPAPLERIPLHVRAGSIVPMGPEVEYVGQRPDDPIELRIYAGADGVFTLYEDEGDGYSYESGASATIPLRWDDQRRTLTIGARSGSFPGMPANVTFRVVLVRGGHGEGAAATGQPDRVVTYSGASLSVRL